MSSKLGLILSFVYVVMFFLFGTDMVSLQFIYSSLDAKSVTIGYLISEKNSIDLMFINSLEAEFCVDVTNISNDSPLFGDVVDFTVSAKYKPLIISSKDMTLSISRSVVIGYYN